MENTVKREDIDPRKHPMAEAVLEAYRSGEEDEAHHVAVAFNLAAAEMVKRKLQQ